MALRLIDPKKAIRWVHPSEKGRDNPTTFHIVPLTEGQSREISAAHPTLANQKGIHISQDEIYRDIFLSNVKMIENVQWPGDTTLSTITNRECIKRFYDSLPPEYAAPIYAAIQNLSVLEEGESKNSGGSSGSTTSSEPGTTPADSTAETPGTQSDA